MPKQARVHVDSKNIVMGGPWTHEPTEKEIESGVPAGLTEIIVDLDAYHRCKVA